MLNRARRRVWIALTVAVIVLIALLVAWRVALQAAEKAIRAALGPEAVIGSIDITPGAVTIENLVLPGPSGWPARQALSAKRIRAVPDWSMVFSGQLQLSRVDIEGAGLVVWRTEAGKWRVVPAWTEKPRAKGAGGEGARPKERSVLAREVRLTGGSVEVIDSAVASPPHRIKLGSVEATLKGISLGALDTTTGISVRARAGSTASLAVEGEMVFSTLDGQLALAVQRASLAAIEPYLLKAAETGVQRGEFDLDVKLGIANRTVDAPGHVKIRDLELKPAAGVGTFMGLPREALVERLKDHQGHIDVPFHVAGRLDDPSFSVGAAFKARLALAAADVLGLKNLLSDAAKRSGIAERFDQAAEAIKRLFKR